jgi:hypothetical protein
MVDVQRLDQAVAGRVDRRCRATPADETVVEQLDHLVLALHARVDVVQGAQPVHAHAAQPLSGEGRQVTA